ncbi:hypothetical protein [Hyalangium sp.]|uniref:hypothetical protein n=1 Tax=Hyalangium sp. TaxID=2028555 RepID=UPI002D687B03|nr:hypothetical protein [Hyalangium sp.]HYI00764.1 hypothetical protein [Hyalangium sp.]
MKTWLAGALTVTLATSGAHADGLRSSPLEATLKSSAGVQTPLSKWRGKPVILFYEDKDSTQLNLALKEELFERGKKHGLLEAAWVVAVANLEKFNFFPARQIALSHVRAEEKKAGVPILVDLEGTLGGPPWALPKKTSTVMLLDATGAVVYSYSGRLEAAEQKTFFDALSRLLGMELGAEPKP